MSQQSGSAASANTTESQRSAYGEASTARVACERTKWSGPPPRSHITVSTTSGSGLAEMRPLTASSSKSGFPRTSPTTRASRIPAPAPIPDRASSEANRRLAGDGGEAPGPVDLPRKLTPQNALEPFRDGDERVEVDTGFHPLPVQEVDEILGGDLARGVWREGTAADPADGCLEDGGAGLGARGRLEHHLLVLQAVARPDVAYRDSQTASA